MLKNLAPFTMVCNVAQDNYTNYVNKMFDVPPGEERKTTVNTIPVEDINRSDWKIGMLIGPSGCGKSTLMREQIGEDFVDVDSLQWNSDSIISNFTHCTPEEAGQALCAAGLSTIPTWLQPFHTLSNGQKLRASVALGLSKHDKIKIDEFTSVVNRSVAKTLSTCIRKYVDKHPEKQVVVASCHYDIREWLRADWEFEVESNNLIVNDPTRGSLRPAIELKLFRVNYKTWEHFHKHHYLTATINKASRCYGIMWDGVLVGFFSMISQPNAHMINAFREHRTVILPDYQGLGIGKVASELVGSCMKILGWTFYSKTTHPSYTHYRNKSPNWIGTSTNGKSNSKATKFGAIKIPQHMLDRVCGSHYYDGPTQDIDTDWLEMPPANRGELFFDPKFIDKINAGQKTATMRSTRPYRKGIVLDAKDIITNKQFASLKVKEIIKIKKSKITKQMYSEACSSEQILSGYYPNSEYIYFHRFEKLA